MKNLQRATQIMQKNSVVNKGKKEGLEHEQDHHHNIATLHRAHRCWM